MWPSFPLKHSDPATATLEPCWSFSATQTHGHVAMRLWLVQQVAAWTLWDRNCWPDFKFHYGVCCQEVTKMV